MLTLRTRELSQSKASFGNKRQHVLGGSAHCYGWSLGGFRNNKKIVKYNQTYSMENKSFINLQPQHVLLCEADSKD